MPSFEHINQQLQAAGSDVNAAELHGMLCGLIAAEDADPAIRWITDCLDISPIVGDLLVTECLTSLKVLADNSIQSMTSDELELQPLLASDDSPIQLRAQSMVDWCEGFSVGMGFAVPQPQQPFSREVSEALIALSDITRMDIEGLEENDEQDNALMEVSEFIWVAAMLIYTELRSLHESKRI